MTTDELIDLGHKAGTFFVTQFGVASATTEWLERFAALVAAAKDAEHQQTLALQQRSYEREIEIEVEAEREECAKLAEATICDTHLPTGVRIYGTRVADAIRARSKG
jgi:hypothetical protein